MYPFANRHIRAILFLLALSIAGGIITFQRMPVSLFPNVTFPRVAMIADNGEEPADRMMVEVTKPLEEAANGIPGVKVVRSTTSRGSSEISIFFEWGTDIQEALQYLDLRLTNVRGRIPASANIRISRMTPSVFPVIGYSLTSDTVDPIALRDLALYTVRPVLAGVSGVAQVIVQGGKTREFVVRIDPAKLAQYHLDPGQISSALEKTNLVVSPGLVNANNDLYLSLVNGLLHTPAEIAAVPVANINGAVIHVADIGAVESTEQDELVRITANGRQAVLVNILQHPDANVVQIGKDVDEQLASIVKTLPRGITVQTYYNQSDFIRNSLEGTRDSILIGLALAMVVLIVFLRNGRVTLVVVLVVPASVGATILLLNAAGQSINIMTLGGIAAAIGLIIDDILVVAENIFRHHEMGNDPMHVTARNALHELMPAMIGSSLATLVIHIPFAFLGGVAGAFFAALSLTMVFALTVSFFFSLLAVPILTARTLLKREAVADGEGEKTDAAQIVEDRAPWMNRVYECLLRLCLKQAWIALPVIAGCVYLGYSLYQKTETGFLPEMDEGAIVLDYSTPPGTSLDESNRMLAGVEKIIMSTKDVASYSRRIGTELGFFITEPNRGDYAIRLTQGKRRPIDEVIDDLRQHIQRSAPMLHIEFGQVLEDVVGDLISTPAPIQIKVFGNDKVLVEQTARTIAATITPIHGIADVFDGVVISGPSLLVNIDAEKISRAGMTTSDVFAQLQSMIQGTVATEVQMGEKRVAIRIRYPKEYQTDIPTLTNAQIVSPLGFQFPLGNIATVERTAGQSEVRRENMRQMVAVTARLDGGDLGSAVRDIQRTIARSVALPAGISLEYGGLFQEQQDSFRGLLMVLGAAVLFVVVVLLFEFKSLRAPLVVLGISIPSLTGVVLALWWTRVSFNLSSFVGAILIVGIVAENAIFILHYIQKFIEDGMSRDEAIVRASVQRLRPVLMTMLTAVFALLPLAIGIGNGTQMLQPLAIAIIGGFSLSTIFLMLVFPMAWRLVTRGNLEFRN